MRLSTIVMAPDDAAFAEDAFDGCIGSLVTVTGDNGTVPREARITGAKVRNFGQSAWIEVEVPDGMFPSVAG